MFTLFSVHRHSYGVIPLRMRDGVVECLLINQKKSSRAFDGAYWTFPKGTPEKGETGMETAIRETKEEVGINFDDIDPDFSYDDSYSFVDGLTRIDKIVTYYIGRASEGDVVVQDKEVHEAMWLPLAEAHIKLTNDHARLIVDAISARLPHARLFASKSV